MDKKFNFKEKEAELYTVWEQKGIFRTTLSGKKPFCIVLPPPNANADLHLGHAMYVFEDIMIRYHKLQGEESFWLAGADHAGIETQFVFEKHLQKKGKSRLDYDRNELYQMIWDFVMKNRESMENQLRKLGFALDWTNKKFTLDEDIVSIVYKTFKHMFDKGLLYRANRLVNYCTTCGTSFSDLEVKDIEVVGKLYYIKFPLKNSNDCITIATTRPETMLGDVAVMVHPEDKRYQQYIGKTVVLPIVKREIPVIADEYVDPKFASGAVKVTPMHDVNDFEIAKKHNLQYSSVIDFNGHMQNTNTEFDGMYVKKARKRIVKKLEELNLLDSIKDHELVLKTCYKCATTLEPLPKEQWFINVKPLTRKAISLIETGEIHIHPKRFKKQLIQILENFIDWNISRQIVWGIRIPAYYSPSNNKWYVITNDSELESGSYPNDLVQDEDTFDTWFSSSQWPFATLQSISTEDTDYFSHFYPTTVMETGYDILRAWVARMIMVGYFETEQVPFQHIYLHGLVRDKDGQKMSKSKGNVINPLKVIDQYGADALRASLVFGTKEGGDVVLSEDKIRSMRNYANKIWNIGRFLWLCKSSSDGSPTKSISSEDVKSNISQLSKEFETLKKTYHKKHKAYELAKPFDLLYEFIWHRYADVYIEALKSDMHNTTSKSYDTMYTIYRECLIMLHPYMPFVTEAVWKAFHGDEASIFDTTIN